MENNKIGVFVSVFVLLIIGVVLLSTTATQIDLRTEQGDYTASNEVITLADRTNVNLANDWVQTSGLTVVAQHGNNATGNITLTVDTDYEIKRAETDDVAQIRLIETTVNYTGNTSYVNYTYQDDNYLRDASSRPLIRLITLFFGIFILLAALGGMYQMGMFEFMGKRE